MNDTLIFAEDSIDAPLVAQGKWKVLVVDDEPEVHNITRLVLSGLEFEGGLLDLVTAYSASQARELMQDANNEFAVAIVDVVMETHHAGLDFVKWVRESLGNHKIRLVLRTGQPGEAPEESVIRDYDINDYKNKTELTALRLKTTLFSALRSYRDILTIERHRNGLEKIIAASSEFIECDTLPQFASAILKQVALVLGIDEQAIICCAAAKDAQSEQSGVNILALNNYDNMTLKVNNEFVLPQQVNARLTKALVEKHSIYAEDYFIGYFTTKRGTENLLYVSHQRQLEPMQHDLLEFFANNIALAHENLKLRDVIKESQKELSYVIGEAVEMRSKETGSHVKRVAHISYKLAKYYGLPEYEADMIRLASPLHDVGKVGIPDTVLNKPDKHTAQEWEIMKSHAQIGHEMLHGSENPILQLGATIAHQHHERWDGEGYPQQLKGLEIDIAGRITALADVFDALGSNRCYKQAWPLDEIVECLQQQKGAQFEPRLVDILVSKIDEFAQFRTLYPDQH